MSSGSLQLYRISKETSSFNNRNIISNDEYKGSLKTKRVRKPIPEKVKHEVWRRDQGKCVCCGSNENLEFDHIIPHSKGGADTARNLQLLCQSCNRKKSDSI
ncbi:HNH endonuclease [Limihaloglobus sulfuriphilus]|uniref:HNH endonuclease n=1 Tax=Limihaloglobus sulfuriphilus TaxID=1851148 RepID=UPI003AABE988